jgi:hypothetical protein
MTILEKFFYAVALLQVLPLAAFFVSLLVVLVTDYIQPRLKPLFAGWPRRFNRQPAGHAAKRIGFQQAG